MTNLLLEDVQYKVDQARLGIWRRYLYPTGKRYAEFRSHATFFGLPLLHFTFGVCPETGKRKVARGIIGIGRFATGVLVLGHVSHGVVALGQGGIGVFALAQASLGVFALGQVALGLRFALGQLAIGYIAIGQFGCGHFVQGQVGFGSYAWSPKRVHPLAVEFFRSLFHEVKEYLGWR